MAKLLNMAEISYHNYNNSFALEVLHIMHWYINLQHTYLLTFLLTSLSGA